MRRAAGPSQNQCGGGPRSFAARRCPYLGISIRRIFGLQIWHLPGIVSIVVPIFGGREWLRAICLVCDRAPTRLQLRPRHRASASIARAPEAPRKITSCPRRAKATLAGVSRSDIASSLPLHGGKTGLPGPPSIPSPRARGRVPGSGDRADRRHTLRPRRRLRAHAEERRRGSRVASTQPGGQLLRRYNLAGWQPELEVMCDARGNDVVVCSIENSTRWRAHRDSWTIRAAATRTYPATSSSRECGVSRGRSVGVATGGAMSNSRASDDERVPPRIEMNRACRVVGARLEGDLASLRSRSSRRLLAAGSTLDELRTTHRQDGGCVRSRLRRRRGQALASTSRSSPRPSAAWSGDGGPVVGRVGLGRTSRRSS